MKIKKLGLVQRQELSGIIYCIPLILGLIFIFIPNFIDTLRFSVSTIKLQENGFSLQWVGLEHFDYAFNKDSRFRSPLLVSTLKTLVTQIPMILIFSLLISVLLNQQFKGRNLVRAIFFLPVLMATGIISQVETIAAVYDSGPPIDLGVILQPGGLQVIENLLRSIDFSDGLVRLVTAAVSGIYTIVRSSGMQIFIFLAALQEIPRGIYEAAQVEGCDSWQLFWKITFPLVSPQILVNSVYTIVDQFSNSESALFEYVDSLAYTGNNYGLATSMYVIYFSCVAVIIAVVGLIMSRFIFYME